MVLTKQLLKQLNMATQAVLMSVLSTESDDRDNEDRTGFNFFRYSLIRFEQSDLRACYIKPGIMTASIRKHVKFNLSTVFIIMEKWSKIEWKVADTIQGYARAQ